MMNIKDKLHKAITLRDENKFEEASNLFNEITTEDSENAIAYYHYAWLFDKMGKEFEASINYVIAIEKGLNGNELKGCLLGLGSTYRNIGKYEDSINTFEKGEKLYPKNNEFKVFKAMTLFDMNQREKAFGLLLNTIADSSTEKDIQKYKNAIKYYANNYSKDDLI